MRKLVVATLVAGLGVMGASAPAMAKTAGKQRLLIFISGPEENAPQRAIASGPISGVGTSRTLSSTEGRRATSREELTLPKGKVFISTIGTESFTFDPRSCRAVFSSNGTWKITGGTGAYAGARGSGTFEVRGNVVGRRDASGKCLGPESGAEPASVSGTIRAEGTATLP